MSDSPHFLFTASRSFESRDVHFAVLPLENEHIDWCIEKIEKAEQFDTEEPSFSHIVFFDRSLIYYKDLGYIWTDNPDTYPLVRAVYHADKTYRPIVIAKSILPSSEYIAPVSAQRFCVRSFGARWEAESLEFDAQLTTMRIRKADLLLAKCYIAATPEALSQAFRALAAEDANYALSILEQGLVVIGGDEPPRKITDALSLPDLAPLLQHSDRTIRERMIVALGTRSKDLELDQSFRGAKASPRR